MSRKQDPYRSLRYYRGKKSPGLAVGVLFIMIFNGIIGVFLSLIIKKSEEKEISTIRSQSFWESGGKPLWFDFPLGIGVFFMPYLFAWFTLHKRYSSKARMYAFGWLGFVVLLLTFVVITAPKPDKAVLTQNTSANHLQNTSIVESKPLKNTSQKSKFKSGDYVLFNWNGDWSPATVIKQTDSKNYLISYGSGNEYVADEEKLQPDNIKTGSKIKAFRYYAYQTATVVERKKDIFIVKYTDGEVSSVQRTLTQVPIEYVFPRKR